MRKRLSKRASKRKFRNGAVNTKAINVDPRVMRGGYRL